MRNFVGLWRFLNISGYFHRFKRFYDTLKDSQEFWIYCDNLTELQRILEILERFAELRGIFKNVQGILIDFREFKTF